MSVILETARTRLRHTIAEDTEFLVALYTDPEVTRYVGGPKDAEKVRAAIAEFLAEKEHDDVALWVLEDKESGEPIGDAGLMRKEVDGAHEIEVVYMLARAHWGRGIATEVAAALRDHAIIRLKQRRLIALIDPDNVASQRVAAKIGMRHEKDTVRPSGHVRNVYAMP